MKPTVHGPAARLAQALGAVAGAWLILSAPVVGAELFSPAADASAPAGTYRIQLAQADSAPVEHPVSFSSDQADRGEDLYARECEECHGDDLRGGMNGGAPLRGLNFEQKYANGAPASALFMFTSSQMPPGSPGRFSPSSYADLVAYIMKQNGFKAGAPLPTDLDALDYLMMVK